MKTLLNILALVAIIAGSLTGVAGDLPFGETAWRNHVATNSTIITVQVLQINMETDEEIVFMDSHRGANFSNYSELVTYVRGRLTVAETRLLEPKFDAGWRVLLYVAATGAPAHDPLYRSINDIIWVDDMRRQPDGSWKFPPGFIETLELELEGEQVLPLFLGKRIDWAKLEYVSSTGEIFTDDTRVNPANGNIRLDSDSNVVIRKEFVTGERDFVLTVGYADGTTESWDETGKKPSIHIPVDTKLAITHGVDGVELLITGEPGASALVQWSNDLRSWADLERVTLVSSNASLQVSMGTNNFLSFRLQD